MIFRKRLTEIKAEVVKNVVKLPFGIPPEFHSTVSAFPMSYSIGKEICDICISRGLSKKAKILIIGAFGGRDYHWLVGQGYSPTVMDLKRPHWLDQAIEGDVAQADTWERAGGDWELVILCDVLEHVADDFAVLKHIRGALANKGALYLSVPFHHDNETTHLRAYTMTTLTRLLKAAGLKVIWSRSRPGILERWPHVVTSFNYGSSLLLVNKKRAGRYLSRLLQVEYEINRKAHDLLPKRLKGIQEGAMLLCVAGDATNTFDANRRRFCE